MILSTGVIHLPPMVLLLDLIHSLSLILLSTSDSLSKLDTFWRFGSFSNPDTLDNMDSFKLGDTL